MTRSNVAGESRPFTRDVCVIGGCGHVGLPLALTFADCNLKTVIYDTNARAVESIRRGRMPFMEEGGQETLDRVLAGGHLEIDETPLRVAECKVLLLIIGTPLDEHLKPSFDAIEKALSLCRDQLRDGQILVLRSTIYPGTTKRIQRWLGELDLDIEVAFCPERAVEGKSLIEFRTSPQIISAFDAATMAHVRELFAPFSYEIIEMQPMEAELAKLMTNAWRYLQFATTNQFYMIAEQNGVDYDRILHGCTYKYPRMSSMPGAGFAAGPCLVKDTMQLAAFSQNNFVLGHAAMLINEGLPAFVVQMAKQRWDLSTMTAGILGMAFKAGSDDPRDSLSYKLRKLLSLECKRVLCTDPFVPDPSLVPLATVLAESDVLFTGAPHAEYRQLVLDPDRKVMDVWNCLPRS